MAPFFAFISLALALIVHATPTPERRLTHVPREATKLAADPETGTIYLFNSRDEHLGILDRDAASSFQRRAGGCADINADEVQQRGWNLAFPRDLFTEFSSKSPAGTSSRIRQTRCGETTSGRSRQTTRM